MGKSHGSDRHSCNGGRIAWTSFADIVVFFAVLLVGFAYVWKRGDLDWVRAVPEYSAGEPHRQSTRTSAGAERSESRSVGLMRVTRWRVTALERGF